MRIISISDSPIYQIPFLTAAPGHVGVVERVLPIFMAQVDVLPDSLDALIATSDLQGIDPKQGCLLGHTVALELEMLAELGEIPSPQTTGIILAGDLYAQADSRGGAGDVREVWQAFSHRFSWVAGVAGNHDRFGESPLEMKVFRGGRGIHYIDGEIACIEGLRIGGLSGIIGKPSKPFRRTEKDFRRAIRCLVKELPDILILHEGPNDPNAQLMGNESIRSELAAASDLLVICGHLHWKVPVTTLPKGVQVLNVDSRVVVLTQSGNFQNAIANL